MALAGTYQLALGAVIFLQHLDVGVVGQASFADGRHIGGFPS